MFLGQGLNPSHSCNLSRCRQCQILDPLCLARDRTHAATEIDVRSLPAAPEQELQNNTQSQQTAYVKKTLLKVMSSVFNIRLRVREY